jgi:hypothetical protein
MGRPDLGEEAGLAGIAMEHQLRVGCLGQREWSAPAMKTDCPVVALRKNGTPAWP